MKDELIKMLPDIKQAIASGVAYGSDLFQRAVIFYTYQTYLFIGMWILLLVASIIALVRSIKWYKNSESYDNFLESFIIFISSLLVLLSFFSIIYCVGNVVKLKTIPEVYMVEKIMYMSGN